MSIPFRRVCAVAEIPDGAAITVELDNSEIALFRNGQGVHATEGRCPHAFEQMSKAVLDGDSVTCLAHHYCFDLRTGKAFKPTPGIAFLKIFPVEIRDGDVYVQFEGSDDEW